MLTLDQLVPGISVLGLSPHGAATIHQVRRFGTAGAEVAFIDERGRLQRALLCREHEAQLALDADALAWDFAADSAHWRLAATASDVLLNTFPGEVEDAHSRRFLAASLSNAKQDRLIDLVDELMRAPGFLYDSAVAATHIPIDAFFHAALLASGGQGSRDTNGLYEIAALPSSIRGELIPQTISFAPYSGQRSAVEWLHAQHPLLRELAEQVMASYGRALLQGSVLVVPGRGPVRLGALVEHGIDDGGDEEASAWRSLRCIEVDADGRVALAGQNPWWAYRVPDEQECAQLRLAHGTWDVRPLFEQVLEWSIAHTVPTHLEAVRRARQSFCQRLAEGLEVRRSSGDDPARGDLLRAFIDAWERVPIMPSLPKIVGGVLLVPEVVAEGEWEPGAAGADAADALQFMSESAAPPPGAPTGQDERSRKTHAERSALRNSRGLYADIPGLVGSGPPPAHRTGSARGARPPRLAQSQVGRLEKDVQRAWRAHEERLQALGVEVDADVELARRNPLDRGMALWIPSGAFTMGDRLGDRDEKPVHQVQVDGFYMDVYPVTQGQFQRFVLETGYRVGEWKGRPEADDHPAVEVSWDDAVHYCQWAGKRLPTEAEWEKAARSADGRTYPWGSDYDASRVCTVGRDFDGTAPVGNFATGNSPYGLGDMAGNVWEWVADYYAEDYYRWCPLKNPYGPDSGQQNVLRGGAWICHRRYLRCAKREHQPPQMRSRSIGFRCAS